MSEERYIPAAGRGLFTPLFDPVMAVTTREPRWRGKVVDEALAATPIVRPRKDEMPTPATAGPS